LLGNPSDRVVFEISHLIHAIKVPQSHYVSGEACNKTDNKREGKKICKPANRKEIKAKTIGCAILLAAPYGLMLIGLKENYGIIIRLVNHAICPCFLLSPQHIFLCSEITFANNEIMSRNVQFFK
jgi:hypothetical protein